MSTRTQIDFINKARYRDNKTNKLVSYAETRRVYRHSDGYPEGVIPDLKEFLAWNKGRNTDIEYQTANFIFWNKLHQLSQLSEGERGEISINELLKKTSSNDTKYIGFGICEDSFHADIEYFYEVITEYIEEATAFEDKGIKTTIKAYEVSRKNWNEEITKENLKLISTEEVNLNKEITSEVLI